MVKAMTGLDVLEAMGAVADTLDGYMGLEELTFLFADTVASADSTLTNEQRRALVFVGAGILKLGHAGRLRSNAVLDERERQPGPIY